MKIIAVGMNYVAHCHELHADEKLPEAPVIFMKPDSALLKDSKPFFITDISQQVDYETDLVVRINRLGKNIAPRFASRYYDAVTVGIDFTARDLQRRFREEGKPWELCKGFDSSAAIGDFVPVDRFKDIQNLNFHLDLDGKTGSAMPICGEEDLEYYFWKLVEYFNTELKAPLYINLADEEAVEQLG